MDPSHPTESPRSISFEACVPLREDSLECSTENPLLDWTTATGLTDQQAEDFQSD